MTLDQAYFDGKFKAVHERITVTDQNLSATRENLVRVEQEVKDLKGNGTSYFVTPDDCKQTHATIEATMSKDSKIVATILGGVAVLAILLPFLVAYLRGD